MSGPLTSTSAALLLLLSLVLLHSPALRAKPLSAGRGRMRSMESGMARVRRDLRDALPYEAQMYNSQPDALRAKGLSQALQQLVENDQRRDQEAAYLANVMRLLSQIDANAQEERSDDDRGDFQGPYPADYDETEPGVSMAKPQTAAAWQETALSPQLAQALLKRYRQEKLLQELANRIPDQRESSRDQEVLRYLVEKILSSLTPVKTPSTSGSRRAKRDVDTAAAAAAAVSSAVTAARSGGPTLRRTRRSLDAAPPPLQDSEPVSLIRVKRLGDEDDDQEMEMHRVMTPQQPVGLQRMKRIDDEPQPQPAKHSRRRRSLTYDPNLLAQHILQYLPQ